VSQSRQTARPQPFLLRFSACSMTRKGRGISPRPEVRDTPRSAPSQGDKHQARQQEACPTWSLRPSSRAAPRTTGGSPAAHRSPDPRPSRRLRSARLSQRDPCRPFQRTPRGVKPDCGTWTDTDQAVFIDQHSRSVYCPIPRWKSRSRRSRPQTRLGLLDCSLLDNTSSDCWCIHQCPTSHTCSRH
jgi:hypothetical protein